MIAQDIVIRPIITEKSMMGAVDKKYTFEVAKELTRSKSQRLARNSSRLRLPRLIPLMFAVTSADRVRITAATQSLGKRLLSP